jgi:capsular polysaccharide biosynthesis protein
MIIFFRTLKKYLLIVIATTILFSATGFYLNYYVFKNVYQSKASFYVLWEDPEKNMNLYSTLLTSEMIANDIRVYLTSQKIVQAAGAKLAETFLDALVDAVAVEFDQLYKSGVIHKMAGAQANPIPISPIPVRDTFLFGMGGLAAGLLIILFIMYMNRQLDLEMLHDKNPPLLKARKRKDISDPVVAMDAVHGQGGFKSMEVLSTEAKGIVDKTHTDSGT